TIFGTVRNSAGDDNLATCLAIDLRDEVAVQEHIGDLQPDYVYHLAAQAFVPRSFEAPWETIENNVRSQLNIILGCLVAGIRPHILAVTSAEVYGVVSPDQVPMKETLPLTPTSPYSVSKVAQDALAAQYFQSHNIPIMRARPFNHFGPGQNARFVAPAFAMQIARIEAGLQEPVISVGDLSAKRDFTDVRDIVAAYHLILTQGQPGAVYNVASGRAHSIRNLLNTLIGFIDQEVQVRVDSERLRPVEIPILLGDATQLREQTDWEPHFTFEASLLDVLNDCRERVRQSIT
ncbi:MAG: GDP-mannose 4,6-dehydratase, partial [Chloroflexota bacterium]